VEAAKRGELAAFDELVGRYQRQATAVAFRLLNNREDAMEVTQDSLMKAYDKLGSLSEPSRFGPWLMRIISNLALNRRRERALRRHASLDASQDDDEGRVEANLMDVSALEPSALLSAREVKELVSRAIDELPEMQRQAITLFCIAELPQKDVAEMLGCSVEAVKWHVFTARKKLKDRLKDFL
jgi:RNA polymerase sigma-70 factor (ECF subfamily)